MGLHKVIASIERPDPALVERYKDINHAMFAPNLGLAQIMMPGIRPVRPEWSVVGPAVTVQLANLDILACAAATKVVQPGDVVVVAAQGRTELSVWGAGLSRAVQQAGGAGVIVDGALESTGVIRELGLPVFARGVFPRAGSVEKAGSVNVPVAVSGVVVNPGDLIVANDDAIYVVPRDWAPLLIDQLEKATAGLRASQQRANEPGQAFFDARNGFERLKTADVDWVD